MAAWREGEGLTSLLLLLPPPTSPCVHAWIHFPAGCDSAPYIKLGQGNCEGNTFIETEEQCAAAAQALALYDVSPNTDSPVFGGINSEQPYGCYEEQHAEGINVLKFNRFGDQNNYETSVRSVCGMLSILQFHATRCIRRPLPV